MFYTMPCFFLPTPICFQAVDPFCSLFKKNLLTFVSNKKKCFFVSAFNDLLSPFYILRITIAIEFNESASTIVLACFYCCLS